MGNFKEISFTLSMSLLGHASYPGWQAITSLQLWGLLWWNTQQPGCLFILLLWKFNQNNGPRISLRRNGCWECQLGEYRIVMWRFFSRPKLVLAGVQAHHHFLTKLVHILLNGNLDTCWILWTSTTVSSKENLPCQYSNTYFFCPTKTQNWHWFWWHY